MLSTALQFLLTTILNLLTLVFLLRFFMQLLRAPFNNPLGLMVMTLSDFAVKPMRRILPSFKKIDLSTLFLALITQLLLQLSLLMLRNFPLFVAGDAAWLGFIGLSLLGVLRTAVDVFFYAILMQVILSWVNPHSPFSGVLDTLTKPVLGPIRRLIPTTNGLDFSPLIALILLQMVNISVFKTLEMQLLGLF
ncbi:MAG: YggT family protein [Methylotenera sp.]|nr:YggT family protein [Methylotenera sp.]